MARRMDVVRIETGASLGTGFLIDWNRVLTSLHVVGQIQRGRLMLHGRDLRLTAAVRDGASFQFPICMPSVEDIEYDEKLDWACIKVRGGFPGATRLPIGELADSDHAAEWHSYGFPGTSPEDGKGTAGTVTSPTATVTIRGEKISAIQLFSREAAAGTGGAVHGYSGAPVMVGEQVVGILVAAHVDEETGHSQEGTLYALPLWALGISLPVLECPYPGLRPFDATDAARKTFFGRDAEIARVLDRLRLGERQILVIGPSGSGKSSFVKAGLVPRLRDRDVALEVRSLEPGARPCERLRDALAGAAGVRTGVQSLLAKSRADGLVLIIDQLEELFTQCEDRAERQRFGDAYAELREDPRCSVVVTLRADFYGDLMDSALWSHLGGRSYQLELLPLRDQRLAEAIEGPARAVGVSVEGSLRERLVADAASEPGALPLLQMTLRILWGKRRRYGLCFADYLAMGDGAKSGLAVALAYTADAVLHALDGAQQAIARRIFLRLVSFGEGRAPTRRQQSIDALKSSADDESRFLATLDQLTNGKLVTRDIQREGGVLTEVVDMAHEALITAWPALAGWIASRQADEQRRRTLEAEVREWVTHGRAAVGLLDAVQLAEADAWVGSDAARDVGYGKELRDFLDTSRRVLDEQHRRRRRGTYLAFTALAVFSIVVSSLAVLASKGRRDAQREANIAKEQKAEARRLLGLSYLEQGRQLVVDGLPQQALPYLVAAREQGIESPTSKMLFSSARPLSRVWFVGHSGPVLDVAISPDGTRVVTGGKDKTARIWDAKTGKLLTPPLNHHERIRAVAFSPDGARVATASGDRTARIWDAKTGAPITRPLPHGGFLTAVAFSADGTRVLTTSSDETARLWDVTTGELSLPPLREQYGPGEVVFSPLVAKLSPDGTRVVTGNIEGLVRVWDASTGKLVTPLIKHPNGVLDVSFGPDGARIVTAGHDGAARIWDAKTGKSLGGSLDHRDEVNTASFSADGARIVTASWDHTARIWDARGRPLVSLDHRDDVIAASFSPDGGRVVTASEKAARVWDAKTGNPLTPWLEHQGAVKAASFSADGASVVTASYDGTARLWDAAFPFHLENSSEVQSASFSADGTHVVTATGDTARVWDAIRGKPLGPLIPFPSSIGNVWLSTDGSRLLIASKESTAHVWDTTSGKPLGPPIEHPARVIAASFSADGARLVTASGRTARVWDASTGQPLTPPLEHRDAVKAASFSADGARIVTASHDNTARVWDARTGRPLLPSLEHGRDGVSITVDSASFSADGTRIMTRGSDRIMRVWDARTGELLAQSIEHDDAILDASFNADGTRIVTSSRDTTARVWDARTGKPFTPPLRHREAVRTASFSPDGTRILTVSGKSTVRLWDATTGNPLTPPLEHAHGVLVASFIPDGIRAVTTDGQVRWSFPLDPGSLEQWQALARCTPYELVNGTLQSRTPPETCWTK